MEKPIHWHSHFQLYRGFYVFQCLFILVALLSNGFHPGVIQTVHAGSPIVSGVSGKKVMLDPGHGWAGDSGAVGNGMKEKDVALDIANRAKTMLEQYGIQVSLSRTGDDSSSLSAAAQRANNFGADLNVSIHLNAGSNATGTESCYQVNHPKSNESKNLAALLTNEVSSQLGLTKRGDFAEDDGGRCARRNSTGWTHLYIHGMNMPAAIIETAFINGKENPDVNALRNRRDEFARAITFAVVKYFGGDPNNVDEADNRTLNVDQALTGKLNAGGDTDSFIFNGTAGQAITIEMNRVDGNVDPFLILNRPSSVFLKSDDDSGGSQNARLLQVLPETGQYKIVAKSYQAGQAGGYSIIVKNCPSCGDVDQQWLSSGVPLSARIEPNSDEDTYYINGISSRSIEITMNKATGGTLDSYLELYDPSGTKVGENDDGGGNRNSRLVSSLTRNGVYRIKARSYNHSSSGDYEIRATFLNPGNLALNRSSYASTNELSRFGPQLALDGRTDTRWSSQFSDPQYIYVDLGTEKAFDTVVLKWETAYASKYGIYAWMNNQWQNLFWTNYGQGGTANIRFSQVTSRFVMMYGVGRATGWGYSLWEFEVYNSSALVLPIVPPEPGDKEPETVVETVPLPLPEQVNGKDILALSLGTGDQAQEVAPLSDTPPVISLTNNNSQTGMPIATISDMQYEVDGVMMSNDGEIIPSQTVLFFSGEAADTDINGAPGIVAYEWKSNLDGTLSTSRSFTIPVSSLQSSQHIISFRAKDNEGNWSQWSTLKVNLLTHYITYIPMVTK